MKFTITKKELINFLGKECGIYIYNITASGIPNKIELEGEPSSTVKKYKQYTAPLKKYQVCLGHGIDPTHHCKIINPLKISAMEKLNKLGLDDVTRKIDEIITHINNK